MKTESSGGSLSTLIVDSIQEAVRLFMEEEKEKGEPILVPNPGDMLMLCEKSVSELESLRKRTGEMDTKALLSEVLATAVSTKVAIDFWLERFQLEVDRIEKEHKI